MDDADIETPDPADTPPNLAAELTTLEESAGDATEDELVAALTEEFAKPITEDPVLLGVPNPLKPYRATMNWGGARVGDTVLVDDSLDNIKQAIEMTILVPIE